MVHTALLYRRGELSELLFVVYAKVEICLAKWFLCIKFRLYRRCLHLAVVANDCTRINLQRGHLSEEITWKFGGK
jgi:hypothetical protein